MSKVGLNIYWEGQKNLILRLNKINTNWKCHWDLVFDRSIPICTDGFTQVCLEVLVNGFSIHRMRSMLFVSPRAWGKYSTSQTPISIHIKCLIFDWQLSNELNFCDSNCFPYKVFASDNCMQRVRSFLLSHASFSTITITTNDLTRGDIRPSVVSSLSFPSEIALCTKI